MKKFPGKIDKLKDQLLAQWNQGENGGIKGVLNKYIAAQKGAMEKNRGKWEQILGDCVASEGSALQALWYKFEQVRWGGVHDFLPYYGDCAWTC